MCKCNPSVRTPFCGAYGCKWPSDRSVYKPFAVVFDLDGTIADVSHRKHHVEGEKKNFKEFHDEHVNDKPNEWCRKLMQQLFTRYEIVIVTGRPYEYYESTQKWLEENGIIYQVLYMRKTGDYRPDYVMKEEILDEWILPEYTPLFMVDDRNQVVDMWRRRGFVCLQCADGNF